MGTCMRMISRGRGGSRAGDRESGAAASLKKQKPKQILLIYHYASLC